MPLEEKRIASGSGTAVSDVNRLVKQQQDMARMMKKMGKMGGLGGLKNMMSSLGGASPNPGLGDGQNSVMDANKMAELQKMMGGNMPNLGNMANRFGGMGLPGLGGKPSKKRR